MLRDGLWAFLFFAAPLFGFALDCHAQVTFESDLELSRPVRPSELISVLGKRSAVLGLEDGHLEGWIYPLKLFRDFHINFLVSGRSIPGATLLRSVQVRPESTTLVYVADTFSVRETIFVPRSEASFEVRFDVQTTHPVEIQVAFKRDLQWMWPAPSGDADISFSPVLNAFVLQDLDQKFNAVAGSPTGHDYVDEYETNAVSMTESSVKLGMVANSSATQYFAAAASFTSPQDATSLYRNMLLHASDWQRRDAKMYSDYVASHLKLELPDTNLMKAYQWAQVSMLQMLVENPFLGTGLVAGFNVSHANARPGFGWFFGRDALWTSLAINAEQDFDTTKESLEFLAKYQRADGKVPHEIAQGASFAPWFTKLPFAYASADATPLFIIGVNDYVQRSGDSAFAIQMWDRTSQAYEFMVSTFDARGFPRNQGVGHGWIEGGELYPLYSELYQNALVTEALRSLSQLAKVVGKQNESDRLLKEFSLKQKQMEDTFWDESRGQYSIALNADGTLRPISSVLSAVPMWFGLLDQKRVDRELTDLSGPDQQTDWGMRILSSKNTHYDPGGYHFGTVWPLFTGWASAAEYRYHHPLPATQNLKANALLTFAGSLGHVTEVLSGNFYSSSETASPDQLWSSAMVVDPLVRGMLGLEPNAIDRTLSFAPHVPADWTSFKVEQLRVADAKVSLAYTKNVDTIGLQFHSNGPACTLKFSPALSLRASVRAVTLDGKRVPFHVEVNNDDQHLRIIVPVTKTSSNIVIHVRDDVGITVPEALPQIGSTSQGVRVVSQSWSPQRDSLTLHLASLGEKPHDLGIWNPREVTSVDGAELVPMSDELATLRVPISQAASSESDIQTVVIHFGARSKPTSRAKRSLAVEPKP